MHFHVAGRNGLQVVFQVNCFAGLRINVLRKSSYSRKGFSEIRNNFPTNLIRTLRAGKMFGFDGYVTVAFDKERTPGWVVGNVFDIRHPVVFRLLPIRIADVHLIHYMRPFTTGNLPVVMKGQQGIAFVTGFYSVRPNVGFRVLLFGVIPVFRYRKIHFVEIAAGIYRKQYQLVESVLVFIGNAVVKAERIHRQFLVLVDYRFKFVVIFETVRFFVQQFGRYPPVVFRVKSNQPRRFYGISLTELFGTPVFRVLQQVAGVEPVGIPSHV